MTSALTTFQQWLLFSSTALVVGCVAWRIVVMPGAARILGEHSAGVSSSEGSVAALGLTAVAALLVAWVLRLVVQVMGFRDPFVPLWEDVSFLLFEVFFGTIWMVQGAVIALLGGSIWVARRRARADGTVMPSIGPAWAAATLLVVALATTLALSGHANGAHYRTLAVTADALHTLAAGCWMGTLGVILTAARSGAEDRSTFAAQITTFSPFALVSGATLVLMGGALSWTHLTAVSDLWTINYGRVLSAKVALAFVIFGLGAWNWKRGLPDLDSAEGAASVRRRGGWEVLLAAGVILLTAVLVHSAKP